MYILKYFAPLMAGACKKNRNYENDNDKLQCFTKSLIVKNVKMISIRFDAKLILDQTLHLLSGPGQKM